MFVFCAAVDAYHEKHDSFFLFNSLFHTRKMVFGDGESLTPAYKKKRQTDTARMWDGLVVAFS